MQAKPAVMAAQSSGELWDAAVLLRSVCSSAGGSTGVRWVGEEGGWAGWKWGKLLSLSVWPLTAGSMSAGPVPQTPNPLFHFTIAAAL